MSGPVQSSLRSVTRSYRLQHGVNAYALGSGTPVVLIPGWPQTVDAYSDIFHDLARQFQTWALDPPGLGESAASSRGYDTGSISTILEEAIGGVLSTPCHIVGHDVGAWIAYSWATRFPHRVKTLTLLDSAIPGSTPPLSFPLADEVNLKLWQFSFNRIPDLPELLTRGREDILLNWMFDNKAVNPGSLTAEKRARYIYCYSQPSAMEHGFAYYRALATSAQQNSEAAKTKLQMPVLALGGSQAVGGMLHSAMKALAQNVTGGVISDCGHFVMEEQPGKVLAALLEFWTRNEQP